MVINGVIFSTITGLGYWKRYGSEPGGWGVLDGVRSEAAFVLGIALGVRGWRAGRRGVTQSGLPLWRYAVVVFIVQFGLAASTNIPLPG